MTYFFQGNVFIHGFEKRLGQFLITEHPYHVAWDIFIMQYRCMSVGKLFETTLDNLGWHIVLSIYSIALDIPSPHNWCVFHGTGWKPATLLRPLWCCYIKYIEHCITKTPHEDYLSWNGVWEVPINVNHLLTLTTYLQLGCL